MKRYFIIVILHLLLTCRYEDDNSKLPEAKLIVLPYGIVAALEAAAGFCVFDLTNIDSCNL